ncbi:MAG: hypothetical protein RL095_1710 [Verrucomicrobiota bacterium]|jgi:hypothetical protein
MFSSLLLAAALAQTPAPKAPEIRLDGPQILRLPPGCTALAKGDLDGDGRLDLLVVDPSHAGLVLLLQRNATERAAEKAKAAPSERWLPQIENSDFISKALVLGDDVYAVQILDFDGDGKNDIAFTGKRFGVGIAFQTGTTEWEKVLRHDQCDALPDSTALASGDLDGDGKADLAALTRDALLIFKGGLARDLGIPLRLGVANPVARGLALQDVDGDGKLDFVLTSNGNGQRDLSVRLRCGDSYGPEFSLARDLASPRWLPLGKGAISLSRAGVGLEYLGFEHRALGKDDPKTLQPAILRPATNDKSALLATLADLQGKGPEIVLADPEGSRLHWHQRRDDGSWSEAREFPSLRGVNSIATFRTGKTEALVVCSPREKTVGFSELKDGRLSFPVALPTQAEPQACCVFRKGQDDVVGVATRDGVRFNLEVLSRDNASGSWKNSVVKLGSLSRDPSGLLPRDLNGDGLDDLIVLFPREAARFFLQTQEGGFAETAEKDPVRLGQTVDLSPARIGFGDFDGDGKEDLLIGGDGYVRAIRLEDKGFKLLDQANARNADEKLRAPQMIDTDGDGKLELIAYEESQGALEVFIGDKKVMRYKDSYATGKIDIGRILPLGIKGGFALAGRREVWSLDFTGKQWLSQSFGKASASFDKASFHSFAAGDLNGDGLAEIAVLDGANNSVDIFTLSAEGQLLPAKAFRVFSDETHRGGNGDKRPDPTQAIIGDFTGDGLDDLVLTCHDRLLVYLGKK